MGKSPNATDQSAKGSSESSSADEEEGTQVQEERLEECKKCPVTIKVTAKTRLGKYCLPYARVVISLSKPEEESIGERADKNGVYTKTFPDQCMENLWIQAIYEHKEIKNFKREVAGLHISGIKIRMPKEIESYNIIRGIQDVKDTKNDRDYYEKVKYTKPTKEQDDEEIEAGSVPSASFFKGKSSSKIENHTLDSKNSSTSQEKIIDITIYMATYSLAVPYCSQTEFDEHLEFITVDTGVPTF